MIALEGISKAFFKKLAVDDVSLTLKQGEIFGLLGPNGAGKTTLIRIINRIVLHEKGIVRFNNELMKGKHLSKVGYLPEERGLYKTMTVYDHAIFLGRLRRLSKKEVHSNLNEWLDKFDIGSWKDKRIEELSKGMAQKVQFICTVLHNPDILILDEPFSGFDPVNIELIEGELKRMKKEGKTILLSTHNMKSVEEICDRVALIHQSKKILEGPVQSIREELKDGTFAVRFKGTMLSFATALWTGFELISHEQLSETRFVAYVKMRNTSTINSLLKTLVDTIEIEAAWEVLPSMQNIFIDLVTQKSSSLNIVKE
jgi:ABC-2 type transport system ATP-binding protein